MSGADGFANANLSAQSKGPYLAKTIAIFGKRVRRPTRADSQLE
jgi:hypothetical protein